jgi:acyl-coenzyme A synthetase/AMP-(fatty) acid ligase/acyl carrier protein
VLADGAQDGLAAIDGWRFGLASTLAADLGNTSLYPALLGGGTLELFSKEVTMEPARFAHQMAEHPVDVLKITPNHLLALSGGRRGAELRVILPTKWLVTGGEALRPDVASVVLAAHGCRLLNHYGPTETTVGVLTFEATSEGIAAAQANGAQTVPIGKPLINTQAYVVDAHGQEQPVGVIGELWIGGLGVTEGYLHRPELTADVFVDHHGARVYRTGDRVRRLADGSIEFLGRADHQIKVRGYRVELGEVEQVLLAQPGVESAVVVASPNEQGETRLVAYAVPKKEGYAVSHSDRPTVERLREWMAAQLPEYMVPIAFVLLDAMPLTANGKVDRAALPSPDAVEANARVAPRTDTERQLVAIWCTVLKKDDLGVTDSFLDLGGHSLLAIRVLGRISKEFGVRLALRTLFETPTIERIAAVIDAEKAQKAADAAMREAALASVENLTDAEVAQLLKADAPAGEQR